MLSSFACLACLSRFHKEVTRSYAQPGPSTGGETCWGREREEENARRESEKNSHRPLSIGERDYDVFRQEARMMIAENSEQMKTSIVARRITGSVSHAIFLCLPETTDATAIKTSNEAGIVNRPLCHLVHHLIRKKSACVISLESAGVFVYYRERMGFKICNSDDRLQFVEVKLSSTSKFYFGFPKIEQGT